MRLVTALAFALALAGALPAAAGTLDRIKESGTVRFGFREDAAPLSYRGPGGQPAGYSVLICGVVAERLAQQLGTAELTVEWVPVTTTDRFDAVAEGRIDLLCGAASITLSRRAQVDFSLPTFVDGAAVLLRKDADPNFDALRDKKIGVRAGTSTEETLRNTLKVKAMPADVVTSRTTAPGSPRWRRGRSTPISGTSRSCSGCSSKAISPRSLRSRRTR